MIFREMLFRKMICVIIKERIPGARILSRAPRVLVQRARTSN